MSTVTDRPSLWCRVNRSRWLVPAGCGVLGLTFLVIQAAHGDPGWGLVSLAIFLAYGGFLVLTSRRSETAALLRGEPGDERARSIQVQAAAASYYAVILVIVGGSLVSLATDGEVSHVLGPLGAFCAFSYLTALLVLRRRS